MNESPPPQKTNPRKLGETVAAIVLGLMVLSAIKNFSTSFFSGEEPLCMIEQRTLSADESRFDLYSLESEFQALLGDDFRDGCLEFLLPTKWEALRQSELKNAYVGGEQVIFNSYAEELYGITWMVQVTTLETSNSKTISTLAPAEQFEVICESVTAIGTTREEQNQFLQESDPTTDMHLTEALKIVEINGVYFMEREMVFRLKEQQQLIEGKDVMTEWLFSTVLNGKWVKFKVNAYDNIAITGKDDFVMAMASSISVNDFCIPEINPLPEYKILHEPPSDLLQQ